MNDRLQITLRDVGPSDALEAYIRDHVVRLEERFPRLTRCRVTVDRPHRHHLHGDPFTVQVDLHVPGGEIVVGRVARDAKADGTAYAAVDDAFTQAAHVLGEHNRRRRTLDRSSSDHFDRSAR